MKLWNNMLHRLMDEANDGTDGGAGGGAPEQNTDVSDDATAGAGAQSEEVEQPEGGKPDGEAAPDADSSANTDGAPESYVDFEMPEGMTVNTEMLEAFTPAFKELGLTQDQAQQLVTIEAGLVQAQQQAQYDAFTQQIEEWGTTAKNDQEYGGDKFEESVGFAQKAVNELGTPELKEALESSGMGNHPEMIRLMTRIGRMMGEDTLGGGQGVADKKDHASVLYPDN